MLLREKRALKHAKLHITRQKKSATREVMPAPKVTHLQDVYICKRHDWIKWPVTNDGHIAGPWPRNQMWTPNFQEYSVVNHWLEDEIYKYDQPCKCARKVRMETGVCDVLQDETELLKRVTLCRKKVPDSKQKQQTCYWPKGCRTY